LFRSIAKVQVMGKTQGVMTYEALAVMSKATAEHKELAGISNEIVVSFMGGNFQECLAAIGKMEEKFGASKLGALYRKLCEEYLKEGKPEGFDGQIVMSEK
jgi:hypothetical protein